MITDDIKNIQKYPQIPEKIREFITVLSSNVECGRYWITEDDYVNVEFYETKKPEMGVFESHEKYTDIQIILTGIERIDYADISGLSVDIPYNDEKDIVFYKKTNKDVKSVIIKSRQFAIFNPNEAHMPQLSVKESLRVKKAVVKLKIKSH